MNVAFTRAKKKLHLIVSKNILENDCLIKDFVRYINHYHPESISTKEYKNYNPSILEILNEHYEEFLKIKGFVVDSDKMEYETEILAKKWIQDVIDTHFVNKYSIQHNIPLHNIVNIKKFENVIDDKKFIQII